MKILIICLLFSLNSFAELFPTSTNEQCVDFALTNISQNFSIEEMNKLKESCRFNSSNLCLYEITKDLDYNKTDDIHEFIFFANSCQYVRPRCVGVLKKYLKNDQFDDSTEITRISSICMDTSFKCFESICSRDHKNCETLEQFEIIAPDCLR